MKKTLLLLALIAGFSSLANANIADNAEIGVTASVGSTGLGLHASYPIQPNLNARVGLNYLNYNYSGTTSQANYDFTAKLRTFDVLADYFPMDNGFRVTGGLVYNGNKIDTTLKANNSTQYTINGMTYSSADVGAINGSVDFKKIAPYLGIGYGNAVAKNKGWGFSADVGLMFQGSPNSTLSSSGCMASAQVCEQLASDISAEKVKLDDKLSNFKTYPIVRVGASYRF